MTGDESASGGWVRQVRRLFCLGTVGGLSDGELLDRFVSRHDENSEAAFEELMHRHGPIVLRLCRSVLGDPHDAEDAFQATFLVLARRAVSIRRKDSVASWLFGVSRRVACTPGSAHCVVAPASGLSPNERPRVTRRPYRTMSGRTSSRRSTGCLIGSAQSLCSATLRACHTTWRHSGCGFRKGPSVAGWHERETVATPADSSR